MFTIFVFVMCMYLVVNTYDSAPADFEKLKTARAQLDQIQTLLTPTGVKGDESFQLAEAGGKNLQAFINAYEKRNQANHTFVLTVMLACLGVTLLCFLFICFRLLKATAQIVEQETDSAGFRTSLDGEIIPQLHLLENNIVQMPEKLTEIQSISRENKNQAKGIFDSAGIVHGNIKRVANAMKQASGNLMLISSAAEGITGSINEIVKNSENAKAVTQEAVAETRNTTAKVGELKKAANSIDSVSNTINEISEQTNLLALNARIEAARAGDAGKGFAVVANEVKLLARQTADATEDIRRKVEHINTITKEMVTQIEQISDTIHNSNEMVTSIALAVENQSVSTREIADNVAQASQGISEVSGKVSANLEFVSGILNNIKTVEERSETLSVEADGTIQSSLEQVAISEALGRLMADLSAAWNNWGQSKSKR
jgi:methyl-accepting chemotaxis protein